MEEPILEFLVCMKIERVDIAGCFTPLEFVCVCALLFSKVSGELFLSELVLI